MTIKDLQPREIWHYFEEITQVPRPSKKEEKISAFLKHFASEHKLGFRTDETGNIIIEKAATKGYESMPKVALQSHIDMVCEKNNDVEHNFETDPIKTKVDGEWLKAQGTTLGADNGIGVAAQLAVLASTDIPHGALECLFTVDEETGLTGAFGLKPDFLTSKILLNLDSEDEAELYIGCAGGIDSTVMLEYKTIPATSELFYFRVDVKGLNGGHSGDDINKGFANANKLLAEFLQLCNNDFGLTLVEIGGGNLHNAIPREAFAVCGVPYAEKESVRVALNIYLAELAETYEKSEPKLRIDLHSESAPVKVIEQSISDKLIAALVACPNGVIAMSDVMPGLVQTSTNLASVKMLPNHVIKVVTSQRSSVEVEKYEIANRVEAIFKSIGAKVTHGDGYPGWAPNPDSEILKVAAKTHVDLFGFEPKIKAIHAGLECGLFLAKYPDLDMVSFGPTMRGVHSPDERLHIPSVEKFWNHLLLILKNIPTK
ncbi:MAG: aminoacyl-histidine dipeptidase [Bacteroidales bacterium]